MQDMKKRGQVTIYVIVAIVIVGLVIIGVVFYPNLQSVFSGSFAPQDFLKTCIEKDLKSNVDLLATQGGYANPEGFIVNQGVKIKYLCYASGFYETCSVQQPMIKNHFENELNELVGTKVNDCVRQLKTEYENRGYSVALSDIRNQVKIQPGKIVAEIEAPMTVTKEETSTFNGFDVVIQSQMYDLLMISQSIVDFESEFGDSETTLYLQYYPDLKIEKNKLGDGSTIYKVSNVVTEEEFTFASRSVAWPPGYGI